MSLMGILYLADIVGGLLGISVVLLSLSAGAAIIFLGCINPWDKKDEIDLAKKRSKQMVVISIISGIFVVFIPNQKTVYAMAAANYAQEVVQNPKAQALLDKIYTLIDKKIEEELK